LVPAPAHPSPQTTRRERQRAKEAIKAVARRHMAEQGTASIGLRAIARDLDMTAPALYRYVASYQDLVHLIAASIDRENAALIAAARDTQPEDDPAAQIICAAFAFRRWALGHREEFGLVFANPVTSHHDDPDSMRDDQTGHVFTELLLQLWLTYRFPVPDVATLDPAVVACLDDPVMPAKADAVPDEAKGLVWVFMQSWAELYGTVTLEVFGHCDPRIIASGALFRAMLERQGEMLGISHELPRLLPMIEQELAR